MGAQLTLSTIIIVASLIVGTSLRRPWKSLHISAWGKFGICFWALLALAAGVGDLFFGFRDGQMAWLLQGFPFGAWIPFKGHEVAFVYMGIMYSGFVTIGIFAIKLVLIANRTEA